MKTTITVEILQLMFIEVYKNSVAILQIKIFINEQQLISLSLSLRFTLLWKKKLLYLRVFACFHSRIEW